MRHVLEDSLGIGPTELRLQPGALALLERRHTARAPDLAVGEVHQEVAPVLDGQVMVERPVLGVFEGDEAVDHDLGRGLCRRHLLPVVQQAVAAESRELAIDG